MSPGLADRPAMTKRKAKKDPGKRDEILAVRCREDFKRWVEAYAEDRRLTPSQLLEFALILMAEKDGREPPPRR